MVASDCRAPSSVANLIKDSHLKTFTLSGRKHIFLFLNRSGTTQGGSQGLWDYPQPTLEASRDQTQRQKDIFF